MHRMIALTTLNSLLLVNADRDNFGTKMEMCNDILDYYGPKETIVSVSWLDSSPYLKR